MRTKPPAAQQVQQRQHGKVRARGLRDGEIDEDRRDGDIGDGVLPPVEDHAQNVAAHDLDAGKQRAAEQDDGGDAGHDLVEHEMQGAVRAVYGKLDADRLRRISGEASVMRRLALSWK